MKKLFLLLFSAMTLFASIGTVVDVVGDATILRGSSKLKVALKYELENKDIIKTASNAKVKIFFQDNTAVSLGQNTTFSIEDYIFDGTKKSNIKFKVLKGFFKTVTGKIGKVAPNRFKLQTKNATIGIRGTVFAAKVSDEADVIMCTDGKIILFTADGAVEVSSGSRGVVRQSQKVEVKQYTQKEKKELIKNAGWHGSMSLEELKKFIKKNFKEPLRSQLLATIQNIYDKDSNESPKVTVTNADDIGFVDDITINDREFDELPKEIQFYKEDLQDGKIVVKGLLESEDKAVHVDSLHVEITTDGGDTWSRATGHDEWEWSFTPNLEDEYEFSLRVVKEETTGGSGYVTSDEPDEPEETHVGVSDTIIIGGFKLTLNADANLENGKLTGSGTIEIPYLSKMTNIANKIDVDFSNLTVQNNIVTLGDITYSTPFTISTPIADLNINSIVFSPTLANNKIVGNVVFKDGLASTFGTINLPNTSKFLPTSFALNIPFESKVLNIWQEKGVALEIASGSLDLSYTAGDTLPKADLNIPSAQFKLGQLLTYANGSAAQVGMADFGRMPTVNLPQKTFLLDTGIEIPSGLSLTFDLNDYTNPKLTFSSSVSLENYTNDFAKNLENATIEVTVLKTGLSATLTGDGGLDPITIIDRGSDANDVKLVFEGDSPSFTFGINNGDTPLSFSLSGITPKMHFGNLFTNEAGTALNKIVSLGDISAPTLNITEPLYLLGSKIKLPSGFSASVDLSDIKAPVLTFGVGVDFTAYDNNIIAKHISGATIAGTLSKDGFQATVTSDKPTPIDIYTPEGVKIVFKGETGPSFGVNITGTESFPEFSISDINADLDFGTLLKSTTGEAQSVIASIGVITQDNVEALSLSLPAKVKLFQSKLAFEGITSTLNLSTKTITMASSVDLSAYTQNPILKALNGSSFDMTITPSAFSGTITIEDELDPIDIWAQKSVSLQINGTPSIGVNVDSGGVSFDFGELSAAIDFGDLLTTAQNSATSVVATFSQAVNDVGNYSVSLENDVYLLGSKFALQAPQIDFNPNIKSITLSSSVNLSQYTEPMVKAFDGASFSASVSSTGFSGSLSKDGGFEPIVVLERGGAGKDVSVEFTSSPTISVELKNSGIDFGFSGGSADVHFGDLLNGKTVSLRDMEDGLYSWKLKGRNKLFSETKAYIENIKNAKLDIKDFSNPKIFFDASIDLSGYGGVLKNVKSADLKNVEISKSGFKGSLSASIGNIDIWKEKHVTMAFLSDPTINISIDSGGFGLGFSDLSAQLNFGDLLNGATATIGNVMQSGGTSLSSLGKNMKNQAKNSAKEAVENVISSNDYSWSIDSNNLPLFGSNILLSELGGSIDVSDFSNPSITFNASADLSKYGSVFKYVTKADLQNVTISKEGFSGSLITSLEEIPVWKEKNVKISFDRSPKFYLKINADGLKVGASDISASVHLGDLLNNSTASLESLGDDVYSWKIDGENKLDTTDVFLSKLKGKIDFGDLKDPQIFINSAKVAGLNAKFKSVTLKNADISKSGFDVYFSANMDDINLYSEGVKKVDLNFTDGETPTVHLKITRTDFSIGLSDLSAKIAFTNLLNDSSIILKDKGDGVFAWSLSGSHNFLNDTNGIIEVSDIGGTVDLSSWSDPVVVFHTVADFTNYDFSDNLNLGIADVTRAEIQKTSIKWNVTIANARANFTILDMGEGPNDDVRVELRNVSGSASGSGGSVDGADGTLFFGKLFTGNKQIGLTYQSSDGGLKTYGFSFSEDIVYKKDDNNLITFKNPSGDLVETAEGVYKVVIRGQVVARSSVLSAISIGELTASGLEISSTGFVGDISATFNNINKSILEGKASISLRGVGLHINSNADMPITLNNFDGDLDLQYFFDEPVAKAALSFASATSSINWSFPAAKVLHVNSKFEFKGLSGTLSLGSLDALSIGLDGKFGYEGINQEITLDSFTVGSAGLAGTIDWTGSVNIFSKLDLENIEVTFAGINTSGTLGLKYSNTSFLSTGSPLNLGLSAVIDKDGIDEFSVDGDLSSIDIPNFAVFNFTGLSASPTLDNFWVSLDGNVKPQHSLFSSEVALEFENLKISSTGISLGSVEANANISGASADLGPLTISITELGLGFNGDKNLFYIHGGGGIALDIIGGVTAGITVFSDKTVSVDNITIQVNKGGLVANGSIAWYDGDKIYGDGFGASVDLKIANMFDASGMFRIGQKDDIFYWMGNASGGIGGGVPFGPLTIYKVGGGVAYQMAYDETQKNFVPSAGVLTLILESTLGTSGDTGYLWNGEIGIAATFEGTTLKQLNLDGTSWVLAEQGEKPSKRHINAHMTITPSSFHAYIDANIEYHGVTVVGKLDSVFSSTEKHVFIGTDSAYAYAFSGYKELGHVQVGLLGFDGNGFFMVDSRAIAFGMGISIDKHWKKDWWGPDPSLAFKLESGAKALIIYRPEFQMLMDVYAEISLRACYGGCVNVGADVNVQVAQGETDRFVWGKAGVSIFSTSMSFSGYIYEGTKTHGSVEMPEVPELEIFDRVEVSKINGMASLAPYIKIYSKFAKAQTLIGIEVKDVKLKKVNNNEEVTLQKYLLDGETNGASYMVTRVLDKDTLYRVTGQMIASYDENGERETLTKDIDTMFRTALVDRIAFTDIVKSITPANNSKDVHEDEGVTLSYNAQALSLLTGSDNHYITDYSVEVHDADDNNIPGLFTLNTNTLVAKFKSNKKLRIYRYCVNEQGDIRETFVLNGTYLNPFNDFSEDDGDDGSIGMSDVIANGLQANTPTAVDTTMDASIDNTTMQAILLAAQQESSQESGSGSSTRRNRNIGNLSATRVNAILKAIPPDLVLGDITLKHPQEALGEPVTTSFSRGKSYSYYRASNYKIVVKHNPTKAIVYTSVFDIRYNNIPAESQRKVEQMQVNLEPTLTVGFDEERIGAMGIHLASPSKSNFNNGFYNEVRTQIDDGLIQIGVYAGIKTKVNVIWTLENKDGSIDEVTETLVNHGTRYASKLLPGIVRGYSAKIQYISEVNGEIILEMPMTLITGDTFNARAEDEEDRQQRQEFRDTVNKARDSAQRVIKDVNVDGTGGNGGFDDGFSQVGGGLDFMGGTYSVGTYGGTTQGSGTYGGTTHGAGTHLNSTHIMIEVGR